MLIWLVKRFQISLDQYLLPDKDNTRSSIRRQTDAVLDKLNDQELTVINATAKALLTLKGPGD